MAALGSAVLATAAERVTVAELEQFLVRQQAAGTSDEDLAAQLGSLELAERLTELDQIRIRSEFAFGERSATAFDLLADFSAFLEPPSPEIPDKDPPSASERQQILDRAAKFVNGTLKLLPDFLATRTTRSFADLPRVAPGSIVQSGLHPTGTSAQEVAYRNGREVATSARTNQAGIAAPTGLSSSGLSSIGEFGPLLAAVIADSTEGRIEWSHWEQSSEGLVAVFHYAVPQAASHYQVNFCCVWNASTYIASSYHGQPAYHGSVSINPSSGAILRVTLEAEFENLDPRPLYQVSVQYGPVDLGGSSSICPLRSVAIAQVMTPIKNRYWTTLRVNDVMFTNYHRFGSTVRVLPDSASP
jgi:hypothetical protein